MAAMLNFSVALIPVRFLYQPMKHCCDLRLTFCVCVCVRVPPLSQGQPPEVCVWAADSREALCQPPLDLPAGIGAVPAPVTRGSQSSNGSSSLEQID